MPNAFNFAASPFDSLTQQEQRLVRNHVDVVYFRAGEVILDVGTAPTHLFVVIKGYVAQFDGEEQAATYGPDDCFDGRGLVAGKSSSRFVAAEEVVAYALAHATVQELIAANATFGALLFSDIGAKLSAAGQRQSGNELQALNMARVDQAFVRPAHMVDAATDIVSVVKVFQHERTTNVLVQDAATQPPRLGIFTTNALQRAILSGRPLEQIPVGELSNWSLISVRPSDQVGDALAIMLRHHIHRVVVAEGDQVHGVLEALDVFSFLSNHSMLITLRINDADSIDELAEAAGQVTGMIGRQFRGGTRAGLIAKMVQDLNARLFDRAWQIIAPPELVANACLFVMGSEGRGEQLLKTDQDNGLILRDGYTPPDDLAAICQRFSDTLARFGYPPCPGGIMLSNPAWRMSEADFAQTARRWLALPEPDSLMNLAIFMDAHAVSGDAHLLEGVRGSLMQMATDNDALLARFASAIDLFSSSQGWWNRLLGDAAQQMNLKKEGIFPLVHGVRSLALAARVTATSTAERIEALVQRGDLSAQMGRELTESLHFFMTLRLQAGLAELDRQQPVSGAMDVKTLNTFERDLLKDTLDVVKRFKVQLRHRFKLGAL
ncbi:MAG: cyclic nucleotide-binding domain-containing protein [Ottowia sp.]|jgi:CBS domain-containing protein|nr:cyclic nucleotide-binding domain-containing protein [Ottowia sp.]MBP9953047.1 cyclic nucleotide-binding domain-containing protein [Ottowia sp.]